MKLMGKIAEQAGAEVVRTQWLDFSTVSQFHVVSLEIVLITARKQLQPRWSPRSKDPSS
jgi:hypothetical protein